ncbi:unnamed protein product [Clavelina lepadiformis]|uniref:Uncharacterized protein n=1 Tax=Clavelina lepadiformis TaxID=159417 RepID=A0ABP0FQE7_CLALP
MSPITDFALFNAFARGRQWAQMRYPLGGRGSLAPGPVPLKSDTGRAGIKTLISEPHSPKQRTIFSILCADEYISPIRSLRSPFAEQVFGAKKVVASLQRFADKGSGLCELKKLAGITGASWFN